MSRILNSADRGPGPYILRFSRIERVLHGMVIFSFFGLVMTGVPLHFSHEPWALFLIRFHGGVEMAGNIHRFCAIITFTYFFTHVASVLTRMSRSSDRSRFFWGPDSMVPQPSDLRDLVAMVRWFLGQGPRPRFDRFSYLEKFDYWAVFWGVSVIGASGLMLWVPEFFARFLPGWVFNVATIVHGDEALLALSFIFLIHFFNGQLRTEKFPLDLVIFTGRATMHYMRDEHPLEIGRLEREGRLEERIAQPPPGWLVTTASVVGICAILVGVTIASLVLWAMFLH